VGQTRAATGPCGQPDGCDRPRRMRRSGGLSRWNRYTGQPGGDGQGYGHGVARRQQSRRPMKSIPTCRAGPTCSSTTPGLPADGGARRPGPWSGEGRNEGTRIVGGSGSCHRSRTEPEVIRRLGTPG